MKLGLDVNLHKKAMVKAISAVLPPLLKHFKLNHASQSEYMVQHLASANCTPLILSSSVKTSGPTSLPRTAFMFWIIFPAWCVSELPELTAKSLEAGDNNHFC